MNFHKGISMYNIDKHTSGFVLTFGGDISAEEIQQWQDESKEALSDASAPFGVIIDMRTLNPLGADAQGIMIAGQKLYKDAGMERSCVVLKNSFTAMQFKRIAQESGIYVFERYIDAVTNQDWSKVAVDWVKNKIDPDI